MNWKTHIVDYEFYLRIERGLAENTVKNYITDIFALAKFISFNNIEEQPQNCSKETLQQFIYQQSISVSPNSQARKISALKSFFNFLISEKLRSDSPADLIEGPKLGRKLPVTLNLIGKHNIFLFDGPHHFKDHYDAIILAQPALNKKYILIIDDWNWDQVRAGTNSAILDLKLNVISKLEIRTTNDGSSALITGKNSDWHQGCCFFVIEK